MTWHTENYCTMFESGGGSGWPAPPGGGSGGSGPGGGGTNTSCIPGGENIVNGLVPIECTPGPGGNPWPTTNANGFLYSRIAELEYKLFVDPFALDPCDSLNLMPLDPNSGFGTMFRRVAQTTPTPYVKARLDSIINLNIGLTVDNFYTTNWDHANGSIVNCDFFPVRITQLPTGFTPESLVEYFRKHTNQFIDSAIGVSFFPYNASGFNDAVRFNASDTNSLGAVVHINMFNDGSVVESNYYHNYTSGHEKHRFTFTTMQTALDFAHPVAGNREFGIYRTTDASHPGDFVFYTMGVDRITDWQFSFGDWINQRLGNPSGFEEADLLWKNVQQNMINFIFANGGQAQFYGPSSVKARPKYADVKDYLKGTIDWVTLKSRLGC